MPLYKNHASSFLDFVIIHLKASLGDVIIFGIIYLLGYLAFKSGTWFFQKNQVPLIFSVICGFFIAIIIEKYALSVGRWEYAKPMPIMPFIKVGLTPVLQMIILPAIVLKFSRKIYLQ